MRERMARDKYQPIQWLVVTARNQFTLRCSHIQGANQVEPVLKDFKSDISIYTLAPDYIAPAGCKPIEWSATLFHVNTKVALKVMDANVDEHVHVLKLEPASRSPRKAKDQVCRGQEKQNVTRQDRREIQFRQLFALQDQCAGERDRRPVEGASAQHR